MVHIFRFFTHALVCALLLSGCASSTGSVESAAVKKTITKDREAVYKHGATKKALKLEDVLARALRYNLDTRVSALDELIAADDVTLQMLNALPSVTAKVQRVGRNNPGGSSSFSLLTQTQSLQPSISSDQYRNTQLLNVEWNLLDAGINIARGISASDRVLIAQERRRKVYHDVVQDAYAAYWRVSAAHAALPVIDDLLKQAEEQITVIDEQVKQGVTGIGEAQSAKARLLESRKQLMAMRQGLLLAEIELKTLIDYPLDKPIKLDTSKKDWMAKKELPKINGDMSDLEETAFMNRPEIREEILNKRITLRDIKLSILETFPGADMVFGFNRDSNSFLSYKSWVDGVVGLTQSINKIITAPARYGRAKKVDELADRRREALVAAILTQVHVAKGRHDFLLDAYRQTAEIDKNAQDILKRAENLKSAGMMSGAALVSAKIDAGISSINKTISYVELQDSYGRFITTMGVDLWDADNAGLSVPAFAKQIRKNLDDEKIFLADRGGMEVAK